MANKRIQKRIYDKLNSTPLPPSGVEPPRSSAVGGRAVGGKHEHTHTKNGTDPIDSKLDEAAIGLTTRGDMVYQDANGLQRRAVGAANTIIQSDGADPQYQVPLAAHIEVVELSGATYDDIQDYINFFGVRTVLSGGTLTDAGSGVVAVASLTGWVKATDSETATGVFFNYGGASTGTLTDLTTHHIYLDYNGGTPQLVTATDHTTHGLKLDHIHLGTAYRAGATMHFHQSDNIGIGGINRTNMHHVEEEAAHRVSGILATGTGTRNLVITTGVLYEGLSRHTTDALNTSVAGTFSYWYYDGDLGPAAWVEVTGQTAISRTQYNALATGLASLGTNRYGVHWLYIDIDGEDFHVVYGQGNYKANEAIDADVPSSLPDIVTNYGVLLAKIICQEGTDTLIISYPWTSAFKSSLATDHGNLAGLADDDHAQYQKETDFTAGSVLFRGSSVITEDNSNLFWDNINKVLGIGTNTPASPASPAKLPWSVANEDLNAEVHG